VASAAEAGAPLADGLVDLALLTVPGLGRPVARLRATPVPVGAQLAYAGHPAGRWLVGHGPVRAGGVHLTLAAPGLTGASGGPALDADGAVAGVQSYGNPSGPAHFIGPELIAAFLATVRPGAAPDSPGSAVVERQRAGPEPGDARASRHTADRRERRGAGSPSARSGGRFVASWKAILGGTVAWASLEALVGFLPELRGALPEPFDLFSHVKNLKGGGLVAVLALLLRRGVERHNSGAGYLTRRQLRAFHRYWVPGVMAAAALLNALSETRWGLELIGNRLFPATTPDPLDLVYSVVFAGALAALAWRRDRSGRSERQAAEDVPAPALARAEAGLRAVVAGTGLSIGRRWAAHRELRRGLERYWGRAGIERNAYMPVHVDPLARALRERADRAGVRLSEAESVELAIRMLYWDTASAPYAAGNTESARRRAVDVGAPVRDAVTAAFARLLPEPLRDELQLDRRHLQDVRDALLRHVIDPRGPPPGARKPPGSHMPEEELAPALRGGVLTPERRDELAAALSGDVRLPGEATGDRLLLDAESVLLDRTGRFGEWVQRRTRRSGPDRRDDPGRVLKTFVLITRRLLLDEQRLRRLPIPPPVWRELDAPVDDPTLRPLAVDAGPSK
jgi:hypothetical protein